MISLILCVFTIVAYAEENMPLARFVVSFTPHHGQKLWVAKALEQNAYKDLGGFQQLLGVSAREIDTKACSRQDLPCLLKAYRDGGIDIFLDGQVDLKRAKIQVYDLTSLSKVNHQSIRIGPGANLVQLRLEVFRALKPFLGKGGLLDQEKHVQVQNHNEASEVTPPDSMRSRDVTTIKIVVLSLFLLIFAVPLFLSLLGTKAIRAKKHQSSFSTKWLLFFLLLIASGLILQINAVMPSNSFDLASHLKLTLVELHFQWAFSIIGGAALALFVIFNLPIVFPTLKGIENISSDVLMPFLKTWMGVALARLLFAALLYLPAFWLLWKVSKLFELPDYFVWTIVLPVSGLLICFLMASFVEHLSVYLDTTYVDGTATEANGWHHEIKAYFIGYMKRIGIAFDTEILDDIIFLPGINSGAIAYGGGFTRTRVVVDKNILKLALRNVPTKKNKEIEFELNHFMGLLLPNQTRPQENLKSRDEFSNVRTSDDIESPDNTWNQFVLDRANLYGLVLPSVQESHVGLLTNNRQDLSVLEELIHGPTQEQYIDRQLDYDDTNPEDKDFLFGLLLQQFGFLLRQDSFVFTFALAFRATKFLKKSAHEKLTRPLLPELWVRSTLIEDGFVALNFGLHHLIQYIYYQETKNSRYLTARATSLSLSHMTHEILARVNEYKKGKPYKLLTKNYRKLIGLSQFFEHPIVLPVKSRSKLYARACIAIVLLGIGTVLTKRSLDYHPTYLQKIEEEREELAEKKRAKENQSKNENKGGRL